jgi:hypothetical protein
LRYLLLPVLGFGCAASTAAAQQNPPAPVSSSASISLASVDRQGVTLSGYTFVKDGRAIVGNNTFITAGDSTAQVALSRGGSVNVCASTKIHLSADITTPGSGLMIALDRGALEAHYTPGKYSDVLLTPDLRILISAPGQADLSLRVNNLGDTCVDNHGDHAPYVLATSLMGDGAYRVQPNQRVLFEHGSLTDVVDNEQESCGCPPTQPLSVASTGTPGANPARPGETVAPANDTAARNPFPLAESEGLQQPPPVPAEPAEPAGTPHMEVSAPVAFDANHPNALPPVPPATATAPAAATGAEVAQAPPPKPKSTGFFGHIGHFFKRLFGGS